MQGTQPSKKKKKTNKKRKITRLLLKWQCRGNSALEKKRIREAAHKKCNSAFIIESKRKKGRYPKKRRKKEIWPRMFDGKWPLTES